MNVVAVTGTAVLGLPNICKETQEEIIFAMVEVIKPCKLNALHFTSLAFV